MDIEEESLPVAKMDANSSENDSLRRQLEEMKKLLEEKEMEK